MQNKIDPELEMAIKGINLFDKYGKLKGVAIIDDEDYLKVKDFRWCLNADGYVVSNTLQKSQKKQLRMHVLILGQKKGFVVDHINRDKLDNRKKNLRFATTTENNRNKKVKGVYWNKRRCKWEVYIKVDNKSKNLGRYNTKMEALEVRVKAEKRYFKEFAGDNCAAELELLQTLAIPLKNIIYMSRRYAEGRSTFAPDMFNESYDVLKKYIDFNEEDDPDNRTGEYRPIKNFPYATKAKLNLKKI